MPNSLFNQAEGAEISGGDSARMVPVSDERLRVGRVLLARLLFLPLQSETRPHHGGLGCYVLFNLTLVT